MWKNLGLWGPSKIDCMHTIEVPPEGDSATIVPDG